MGSYNTRWCEKHGEWEQDVDDPYAECPQCVEEGTSPTQLRYKATLAMEAELKKLMDEIERLQADLAATRIAFEDWKVMHSTAALEAEIERLRSLVYSYPPTEFAPEGWTWQQEAEKLRGLLRDWLDMLRLIREGKPVPLDFIEKRVSEALGDDLT